MTEASQRPEAAQPAGNRDGTVVPIQRRRDSRDPLLRTLLGGVLRHARHDQKRSLANVAAAAGVSVPYLSEIERGRKEPSSEMLAAVCGALDLDLLDLVSKTYIDLVDHRSRAAEAVLPQRIGQLSVGRTVGRPGDVLALAA
jgi:transcriptional regulator with XRE-family HTH domain